MEAEAGLYLPANAFLLIQYLPINISHCIHISPYLYVPKTYLSTHSPPYNISPVNPCCCWLASLRKISYSRFVFYEQYNLRL